MVNRTRNATTSGSSVRTILTPPVPLAPIAHLLQLHFFGEGSAFVGINTSVLTMAKESLLSWPAFKAFLRKNHGDSRAFVDIIWSRVKWDFNTNKRSRVRSHTILSRRPRWNNALESTTAGTN